MASTMPHRIDTHAHMLPPFYREACIKYGHEKPDGMPALPQWSEEAHLKLMEDNQISKSILSISSPGTHLVAGNDQLAADLARQCNAYAADLKRRHPDRFGYFAVLPIPNVASCLYEIEEASKEGCDGFVMLSNGHGIYPGDPSLDAVFDALDARSAILFVHPASPMCRCATPDGSDAKPTPAVPLKANYPSPFFEFFFDTARMLINLFLSGTLRRCKNLRIILPHLGGALPPVLSRFPAFSTMVPGSYEKVTEEEVMETLRKRAWFDLAGVPFPGQIIGLVKGFGISPDKLLYGSDYPFTPPPPVAMFREKMDKGIQELFDKDEIEKVYYGNAENLLAKN